MNEHVVMSTDSIAVAVEMVAGLMEKPALESLVLTCSTSDSRGFQLRFSHQPHVFEMGKSWKFQPRSNHQPAHHQQFRIDHPWNLLRLP